MSADEIGCDCCIGQNVTIGTNGRQMGIGESTSGNKPRIGNVVRIYPGAIVSGKIHVGDFVIIAGNSVVTKDVPSFSIVYGINQIKPLAEEHYNYLQVLLHNAKYHYVKVPALKWMDGKLYIDNHYLVNREKLICTLGKSEAFRKAARELFIS